MTSADAPATSRSEAVEKAEILANQVVLQDGLSLPAFRFLATPHVHGTPSARLPDIALFVGMNQADAVLTELFLHTLVAWKNKRAWIYTQEPRNPDTNRLVIADLHMAAKSFTLYGKDFYRMYQVANAFPGNGPSYNEAEWRAKLSSQIAPNPLAATFPSGAAPQPKARARRAP